MIQNGLNEARSALSLILPASTFHGTVLKMVS